MERSLFICVTVICLSMMAIVGVNSQCEPHSGTENITGCVSSNYFPDRKYQAAVCMRRSTLKSLNKECDGFSAEYCWYYCSMTPNNPGVSKCECDPEKNNSTLKSLVALHCYTPDGNTCSWYQECLETRIPCESTAHPYAITYAEKYCKRFENNYHKFSKNGKKWVDAVRKCLQESLAHVMYPQINVSCEYVKEWAFRTHINCYRQPSTEIGLRDLSIGDCWNIFWTIKGAFVDAFSKTLHGSWPVLKTCFANSFPTKEVKRLQLYTRIQNAAVNDCDKMATFIAKRLAIIQKWPSDIMYKSYCPKRIASQSKLIILIHIMISHKNSDETLINGIINTLKEGALKNLTLEDGRIAKIEKIKECVNPECTSTETDGCSSKAQEIACKINATSKIILLRKNPSGKDDGADPYSNIQDACNGKPSKRSNYPCKEGTSPGGVVCLTASILQFIYDLGTSTKYTFQVNAIAGACHKSTSKHYLGQAVDLQLHKDSNNERNQTQEKSFMDACEAAGGWTHGGTHVHCQIGGDQACITRRGTCQENYKSCDGEYKTGLCGGEINRQCCLPASDGCSSKAQEIACNIKETRNITLLTYHPGKPKEKDGADPYSNIRDACDGKPSKRSSYSCKDGTSPGGIACLKARLLQFIYDLGTSTNYTFQVNAIAGACHTSTSKHYSGQAVDLQLNHIEGVEGGRNETQRNEYMDACEAAGGWTYIANHVHCEIGGDEACNSRGGTCQKNKSCGVEYKTGLCGGEINRQCCLPASGCTEKGGTCKNKTNQRCRGDYETGLCKGGKDIQCCPASG